MARNPAVVAILLLLMAAYGTPAHATTDCSSAETNRPFPADWNWVLWGPLVDDFENPNMMDMVPGWLADAFAASKLFTINTSATFGSYEIRQLADLLSPYSLSAVAYQLTVPDEEVFGKESLDELLPADDEVNVIKRQFFHAREGSHLSAILGFVDYEAMNITQPTTVVANSIVNFAYYALAYNSVGCQRQDATMFTFSTAPLRPDFSLTSYGDVVDVLPSLEPWLDGPDSVSNITIPGIAYYQYWPLVVRATGQSIPVFVKLSTTLSTDSLSDAKKGMNSTGTGFSIAWLAGDEEVARDAGLEAGVEEVYADLVAVLMRLNNIMNGAPPAPAPAPALTSSAIPTAAGAPTMMMLALVMALLTPA